MDALTFKALADLGIAGYKTFQNIGNIRQDQREQLDAAGQAKQAGQETYADLTEGNQFRVRQAPTKAADLTLNLAEQGLDRTRDRSSETLAGATANLGVDPRTGIAGVQRLLGQLGQMEGAAEQRAAQQSIGAQKLIDDSIYNQQEAERRRLEGLKTQFELMPAMQEYTRATGAAEALENAEREAGNQFISDALASTTNLIAGLDRNKSTTNNNTDDANKARLMSDYLLQTQLAQPIPITDDEIDGPVPIENVVIDPNQNIFGGGEITLDPEEEVEEDRGNPFATQELIQNLSTYEPATAPFGVPTLNAVNRNAAAVDPVTALMQGVPQSDRDTYRSAPTGIQSLDPRFYTSVTDPFGVEGSSAYQGSGPASTYSPLSPLSQQVFGGMQGYNPLGFEQGGSYIAERGGMTEGEFDHDTNKKAIVDQETGRKEGEMTGGEGVFNEDQLAEIVEMIKEGDEDGLLTYLKNLLEEPQFGYEFA